MKSYLKSYLRGTQVNKPTHLAMKLDFLSQLFTTRTSRFRFPSHLPTRSIHTSPSLFSSEILPKPPPLSELVTEQDNADAAAWVEIFNKVSKKIPKELVELSFSRSSGPGGQNVNKVNTKVTARCSVNEPWIPRWAVPSLKKNPHFVESTQSILMTSTAHRSQAQNREEVLQRLYSLIMDSASEAIKKAPSKEQTKKVDNLIKAEKARRKMDKMKRSSVKQGRSAKGGKHDF